MNITPIFQSIRRLMVPIHPEGYIFIAAFALVTLILHWIYIPLGLIASVFTIWCICFFRDPPRQVPQREGLVLSPADGEVCLVDQAIPPPELNLGDQPLARIAIFMSVFNCHMNRAPLPGKIKMIAYRPGVFVNADLDKASEHNERNGLVIETPHGDFGIVQIAGLLARRIVCFAKEGQEVHAGERFGIIRFGSRVDVYFPASLPFSPLVGIGSKVIAGESILADLNAAEAPRTFQQI